MDFHQRQTFLSPPLPLTGSCSFLQEKLTNVKFKTSSGRAEGASDTYKAERAVEGVSSLGHNNSHFKKNWFTAFFLLKQGPTLDTPQAQPFCHKIQAKKLELLAAGRSKGQLQAATHSPQPCARPTSAAASPDNILNSPHSFCCIHSYDQVTK